MARYDKTIAGMDYVFNITITTTPTTIFDLLQPNQQLLLAGAMGAGDVLDGYVVSYVGSFNVTRDHDGAGVETVVASEKYVCPSENWVDWVMVSVNTGTLVAAIRVFTNTRSGF